MDEASLSGAHAEESDRPLLARERRLMSNPSLRAIHVALKLRLGAGPPRFLLSHVAYDETIELLGHRL